MSIQVDFKHAESFVQDCEFEAIAPQVALAHEMLHNRTGIGNDYIGWLTLPTDYDREEFRRIESVAKQIQSDSDVLIVIGIGGSYLGSRAAIEFLKSQHYNVLPKETPDIYFAGNTISPASLKELLMICKGKSVSINIISKSGTTIEPAIAFRVLKDFLEKEYGKEEARKRIYCTTDKAEGTLKQLADAEGYETFIIPDNIGGRYSVLTAVGLLPIAVCGADITAMMQGAADAQQAYNNTQLKENPCYQYAALRNILNRKGKDIELLVSYEPCYTMMCEWWKQLYGESEGKEQKGIFPASAIFSTDLHSIGQYIQEGKRTIFETVVLFEKPKYDILVKNSLDNADGLNFLQGKPVSYINQKAFEGTVLAHHDGGVPNIVIQVSDFSEYSLGYLIYFFEKACAVSGYLLGVNPFNQPGVESYKKNMFALLDKPGYEDAKQQLKARLKK